MHETNNLKKSNLLGNDKISTKTAGLTFKFARWHFLFC